MDFTKRDSVMKFVGTTSLTSLVLLVFSIVLSSPEKEWYQAVIGLMIMYVWVYFVHRSLHSLPMDNFLQNFNTHYIFHHGPEKILDRRIELAIEMVNDFFMSFSVLVVQWITGIWIVPISVILFYAFTYTSAHIINYSIIGSETHRKHHINMHTNFGPDTLDHIFGTSFDGKFEDLMPISVNAIGAFVAVYILKDHIQWKN